MVKIRVAILRDGDGAAAVSEPVGPAELTVNDLFIVLSSIVDELRARDNWVGPRPRLTLDEGMVFDMRII
jgi:hypothetical protein